MIRTITALFDDTAEAEAAFDSLSRRLPVMKGAIVTCGPGERPDFGSIYLSRGQRESCEAELKDGGSLLIVQVEGDDAAGQAVAMLDRQAEPEPRPAVARAAPVPAPAMPQMSSAPPRRDRVESVPLSKFSRQPAPVDDAPEPEPAAEPAVEAETRIPLVEEELRIGKRSMVRGGARVSSYMEEVPVVQEVELLEEFASIERRPVNRRLDESEIAASGLLQDRVVEVAQMREEAVVTKEAFVREELVIKKTVETRIERIDESVRRTAVEMEQLEPEPAGTRPPR